MGVATPARSRLSVIARGANPTLPTGLDGARLAAEPSLPRPASVQSLVQDCLPGVHRTPPRGGRLGPTNPSRITLATEPSGFRWWGFAPHVSVTHSDIRSRAHSTAGFRCRFHARSTLPYHGCRHPSGASARRFAPLDSRRIGTRPVSCYALFQGWLLLSQPPGCLRTDTSLTTQRRFRGLSGRSGLFPS